jgi:hypothetical protein
MSDDVKLTIRTADQTRRAQVGVAADQSVAELIQAAVDNWKLPTDADYTLVNVTRGTTVVTSRRVGEIASPGDVLEVQPVLVAGARPA